MLRLNRRYNISAFIILFFTLLTASSMALVMIQEKGCWPDSWPKELEPYRTKARTIEIAAGNQENVYEIFFQDRADFENIWPTILELMDEGAPLRLKSIEKSFDKKVSLFNNTKPLVRIFSHVYPAWPTQRPGGNKLIPAPPWPESAKTPTGELPEYVMKSENGNSWVPAEGRDHRGFIYRARTDIELVADGRVIDPNRIRLPIDNLIIDQSKLEKKDAGQGDTKKISEEESREKRATVQVSKSEDQRLKEPVLMWIEEKTGQTLFDIDDIVRFDWDKQIFELTRQSAMDLMSRQIGLYRKFRLVNGTETIYSGAHVSGLSSIGFPGPAIVFDEGNLNKIKPPLFKIDNGYPEPIAKSKPDLRYSESLKKVLQQADVLGGIDVNNPPPPIESVIHGWFGENNSLKALVEVFPETFRLGQLARVHLHLTGAKKHDESSYVVEVNSTLIANNGKFKYSTRRIFPLKADGWKNIYVLGLNPWVLRDSESHYQFAEPGPAEITNDISVRKKIDGGKGLYSEPVEHVNTEPVRITILDRERERLSREAQAVMIEFQNALKLSNWEKALSFCSEDIKSKSKEYPSLNAFFNDVVPIHEITDISEFNICSTSINREHEHTKFGCFLQLSEPNVEPTIDWEWSLNKTDKGWAVDFKAIPLKSWIEQEQLRLNGANERAKESERILKEGLRLSLIPLSSEFVTGQPMLFRLKITNVSNLPVTYEETFFQMINDPMVIKGPGGEQVPYLGTSIQTCARKKAIEPNQTITLVDKYDVTTQYHIARPGRYSFQFRSVFYASNVVEMDIKQDKLSPRETIVEKLFSVLPEGWNIARWNLSDTNDSQSEVGTKICIELTGMWGIKGAGTGYVGVLILINPSNSNLARWCFNGQFWGQSPWGPVYVRSKDAELLWPNYKEQIINALNIKIEGQKPAEQTEGEKDIEVYEVNRSVSDFPEKEDFSTPESAYAAINRVSAGGDPNGWQKVSIKSLADRLAAEQTKGKTAADPEWARVLMNTKILEVRIWKERKAIVIAELPQKFSSKTIRSPIDVRWLEFGDGRWLNAGNDRTWTIEEARAKFNSAIENYKQDELKQTSAGQGEVENKVIEQLNSRAGEDIAVFNSYFPDDKSAGERLDKLFDLWSEQEADSNALSLTDQQILEVVRNGFRRTNRHTTLILRLVGNRYIWGKSPQNEDAIDLMYHASYSPDSNIRGYAEYFGLSVVERKSPEILKRLAQLCANYKGTDTGRIIWGVKNSNQVDEFIKLLQTYLNSSDPEIPKRAENVIKELEGKAAGQGGVENKAAEQLKSKADESLPAKKDLQNMINSAKVGETIIMPKGVFSEPISINKSLTLKGEDANNCIIEVTANQPAVFIDTKGKGKVSIGNLTIKWQLATGDKNIANPFAVLVKDSKADFDNCTFLPLGNYQRSPVALRATGFTNLTIDNCRFEGYGYTVQYYEGTSGTIQDSIVTKSGHQGISLHEGANVEIIGNIVAGSLYHGIRSTGGRLNARDNLIINNKNRGIYLGNKSASGVISNNVIIGNSEGISGFANSQVTITNNIFADSTYAGIDMRDSCRLNIKDNIFQNNETGLKLFKEAGGDNNKVYNNTFWKNKTAVDGFEMIPVFIEADPQFTDANNGDFSLKSGPVQEQKQGLTNPEVIKNLWRKWQKIKSENTGEKDFNQTNED